ncbi:acyl-CoA thioesterase [Chamaesiphon minutus]|uniref:Putative thioesterase n=1 Tax=Chamaesiphon minutus (strain ATCC 27169 / PCC 6605) TaxID=1173020 RepID=K9UL69_CHAP6|nr:thioesterase family protein [Chamaesiphon minutus]AFY94939.1 putative thioesterase [Chamaesiphon minutus PCC 6605]
MSFEYSYVIQFRDTDAAGVVYFVNLVSICHVAYEASLIESGIELKTFVNNSEFAVPIAHVSADFFRPLYCGDRVKIDLRPCAIDSCKFEIKYQILSTDLPAIVGGASPEENRELVLATATTKHVVIDPQTRRRREFAAEIVRWLARWS